MSLSTGLLVYYKLEDLTESVGGLTLTNNNSVTFSSGKVNNAANFVSASHQSLSLADNAVFHMGAGQDFSLAAWVKYTTSSLCRIATYGYINENGYAMSVGSDEILARVFDGTNTAAINSATNFNDGAWHLAVMTVSRAGNLTLYVDNVSVGTPVSMSGIGTISSPSLYGFSIGSEVAVSGAFLDGSIDEVGLWNRVLTSGELSSLWNSGAGVTYPFATDVTVNLTGVSASPAIGDGTVTIGTAVVTPPPLVAGGGHRASWDWWPNIQDERVLLTGVTARPRVGSGTVHALRTLREIEELYPFPKVQVAKEPRRIPPLVVREPAKPPPPPYMVSVGLKGAQPMTVIGTGRVKIVAELSEYELMMLAAMDNL